MKTQVTFDIKEWDKFRVMLGVRLSGHFGPCSQVKLWDTESQSEMDRCNDWCVGTMFLVIDEALKDSEEGTT